MAVLKTGVIIGRFQVPEPTDGHKWLFGHVAAESDTVVYLLGVSAVDGYTAENPLTFNQRRAMLNAEFNGRTRSGITVLPLKDCRTNEEWSAQIDTLLATGFGGDDITLYGGRDSFTESYKGKHPVKRVETCPVIPTAGTITRAALKEENVPDFYRGQIYALNRQFPHAYPTVDMAVLRMGTGENQTAIAQLASGKYEVLLIQREDSGLWCFPGGFVDPSDETLEHAAARELSEETGLSAASGVSDFQYVGSFRINDFRYRGTRDKIITTLFAVDYSFGPVAPNYTEVQDYKWVTLDKAPDIVAPAHLPLLSALVRYTWSK